MTGFPPTHAPAEHTSVRVQALPSLQAFVLLVKMHPVAALQLSVVHGLLSLQVSGDPAMQPDVGLQLSTPLQTSSSLHTRGAPGMHDPPPHVSPTVQALPSLQGLVLLAEKQPVDGLHVSLVHALWSSQSGAVPDAQSPAPSQFSRPLHALPSEHVVLVGYGRYTQPTAGRRSLRYMALGHRTEADTTTRRIHSRRRARHRRRRSGRHKSFRTALERERNRTAGRTSPRCRGCRRCNPAAFLQHSLKSDCSSRLRCKRCRRDTRAAHRRCTRPRRMCLRWCRRFRRCMRCCCC